MDTFQKMVSLFELWSAFSVLNPKSNLIRSDINRPLLLALMFEGILFYQLVTEVKDSNTKQFTLMILLELSWHLIMGVI